jgi:hypothetical protein
MPDQLAESVGSAFSSSSLSWQLLALRLDSLLESIRYSFDCLDVAFDTTILPDVYDLGFVYLSAAASGMICFTPVHST